MGRDRLRQTRDVRCVGRVGVGAGVGTEEDSEDLGGFELDEVVLGVEGSVEWGV
jgi:hypothetical protein